MMFGALDYTTRKVITRSWFKETIDEWFENRTEDELDNLDYSDRIPTTAHDLKNLIMEIPPLGTISLYRANDTKPALVFTHTVRGSRIAILPHGTIIHFDGCTPDGLDDEVLALTNHGHTVAEIFDINELKTEDYKRY